MNLYSLRDDYVTAMGVTVPRWVDQDVSIHTVAAILEGGCASGAYMPAVTYHEAMATMAEHGDDIFTFIEDHVGDVPKAQGSDANSWAGMACHYVSIAVELWASSVEGELDNRPN